MEMNKGDYLYLYQRSATKADHTVASFTVDDVEGTVKGLSPFAEDLQGRLQLSFF